MKTRDQILADDARRIYGRTEVYATVESFAAASGLPVEFVRANGITVYNNFDKATGIGRYELKGEA
jgi:hypothetical protein